MRTLIPCRKMSDTMMEGTISTWFEEGWRLWSSRGEILQKWRQIKANDGLESFTEDGYPCYILELKQVTVCQ